MGLLATGSGADDVHESRHQPMLMQTLPSPPWYRVQLPALLPGTRCYTDASTSPDMQQQVRRTAGLGVLIVNNHQQPTSSIYIKAVVTNINSVLMAEASASHGVSGINPYCNEHHQSSLSDR